MTRICFSILVHESYESVISLIRNINYFVPNCYIVLHISISGILLRSKLQQEFSKSQNVFVNPISSPTRWGWILHPHILNYLYFKNLKIQYDYFALEASNSMYIRKGYQDYINRFDFASALCPAENLDNTGSTAYYAVREDCDYLNMTKSLNINNHYISQPEGTTYKSEIFDEIMRIIQKFYRFNFNEFKYPREEIYFPTLARHLSSNFCCETTLAVATEASRKYVDVILSGDLNIARQTIDGWSNITKEYLDSRYAIKAVPRNPDAPLRKYIEQLQV